MITNNLIAEANKVLTEKGISVKDIVKAIKKDKSRSPGVLLLVYHNGREMHVAVDLDTFKKKASSYFGTDEDGEEIEFEINDVSRIE